MGLKSWSKKQPADAKYSEIESETNNHRLLVGVETNLIKKIVMPKTLFCMSTQFILLDDI